jgi:hypothetical protein
VQQGYHTVLGRVKRLPSVIQVQLGRFSRENHKSQLSNTLDGHSPAVMFQVDGHATFAALNLKGDLDGNQQRGYLHDFIARKLR